MQKETQNIATSSEQQQAVRNDLEEEDNEESYYRYMEENPNAGLLPVDEDGIEIGNFPNTISFCLRFVYNKCNKGKHIIKGHMFTILKLCFRI